MPTAMSTPSSAGGADTTAYPNQGGLPSASSIESEGQPGEKGEAGGAGGYGGGAQNGDYCNVAPLNAHDASHGWPQGNADPEGAGFVEPGNPTAAEGATGPISYPGGGLPPGAAGGY